MYLLCGTNENKGEAKVRDSIWLKNYFKQKFNNYHLEDTVKVD